MIRYRFYSLDEDGHVTDRTAFDAADDITALEAAQKLCEAAPLEIWDGARRVAPLDRDGTALSR